jgi:hypothetical protein
VPNELALPEPVECTAAGDQVDRAVADQVDAGRDGRAGREVLDADARGQRLDLLRVELGEELVVAQELGDVLARRSVE